MESLFNSSDSVLLCTTFGKRKCVSIVTCHRLSQARNVNLNTDPEVVRGGDGGLAHVPVVPGVPG